MRRRILVAEDNQVNQRLMAAMLQQAGHQADIVSNGVEALQALATLPYDVILMDIHMPEMDGIEATRHIRAGDAKIRHVPIIALTANAMQGDRERFLAAGMNGHVVKPIDRTLLLDTIAQLAEASTL